MTRSLILITQESKLAKGSFTFTSLYKSIWITIFNFTNICPAISLYIYLFVLINGNFRWSKTLWFTMKCAAVAPAFQKATTAFQLHFTVKTMVFDQLHFCFDQKPWFLPWNAAEMQFVTFDILKCLERPLSENHGCYNEMPLKWKKAMQRQLKSKSNIIQK